MNSAASTLVLGSLVGAALLTACTARVGFFESDGTAAPSPSGPQGCVGASCGPSLWSGVAGSDLGSPDVPLTWGSAAGGGVSGGSSSAPSVAVDSQGRIVVGWLTATTPESDVFVRRFESGAWRTLGSSSGGGSVSATGGAVQGLSLGIGGNDQPIVAWVDASSGNEEIFVRRFDGTAWLELGTGSASAGGISDTPGPSLDVSMAVDAADRPVVVWGDEAGGEGVVYARRFDGSTWIELGAGSASGDGLALGRAPEVSFEANGQPVVALQTGTGIWVQRWDGAAWLEVGVGSATGPGLSGSGNLAFAPDIASAANGQLLVTWTEYPGAYGRIYGRLFDGNAWVELDGSAAAGGLSEPGGGGGTFRGDDQSVAVFDVGGAPVVAWHAAEINVRRFDGSSWVEMGAGSGALNAGISAGPPLSRQPSMARSPTGVVAAWSETTDAESSIHVRLFDGTSWVELNPGNASGGGVSNTALNARDPALALDLAGNPIVAWTDGDDVAPSFDILMRRFDGTAWVEMGSGSASGGGVTDNTGVSHQATLVTDSQGEPMLFWYNFVGAADFEIFALRWQNAAWSEVGGSNSGLGISQSPEWATAPSAAMSLANVPFVAWENGIGTGSIYVKQWTGSAWSEVGAGGASGQGVNNSANPASEPCLAVDDSGRPSIAWIEDTGADSRLFVRRFDGASWAELAGSASGVGLSGATGIPRRPRLVIDGTGEPLIAWIDDGGATPQVLARRYDGVAWVDAGAGSSVGGLSNSSGQVSGLSAAVSGSGEVLLAWADGSSGNTEIYLRRLRAGSWEERSGSASGGGISNSTGFSHSPALAARGTRACVAWVEQGQYNNEIVLRCTDWP